MHGASQQTLSTQKPGAAHCAGVLHMPPMGTGVLVGVVTVAVGVLVGVKVGVPVGVCVGGWGGSIDLQESKRGPSPQVAVKLATAAGHPNNEHTPPQLTLVKHTGASVGHAPSAWQLQHAAP